MTVGEHGPEYVRLDVRVRVVPGNRVDVRVLDAETGLVLARYEQPLPSPRRWWTRLRSRFRSL